MTHRSMVRHIFLDVADADHDRELVFWAAVTGNGTEQWLPDHPEFHTLQPPEGAARPTVDLHVQRVGAPTSGLHLDIEADDVDAEVTRLERLGAERGERFPHWQVMRSPAGIAFCVVGSRPGELEAAGAPVWDT